MTEKVLNLGFKASTKAEVEIIPLKKLVATNKALLTLPHRTDFYHIFLLTDCSPKHWVDFTPIQIEPFSVLCVDKGRVHQFDPELHYEGHLIVFTDYFYCLTEQDASFLHKGLLFNDINNNPYISIPKHIFFRLEKIIGEIQKEFDCFDPAISYLIQQNLLHNFLLLSEREKQKISNFTYLKSINYEICQNFKSFLENHFKENKSVSFYAKCLAISEKRLGQATGKIMGKPPKEIINQRVLLEAKRMLAHSQSSIKEIGYNLGFDEPTNFIKYFKKQTTVTPLEFKGRFNA